MIRRYVKLEIIVAAEDSAGDADLARWIEAFGQALFNHGHANAIHSTLHEPEPGEARARGPGRYHGETGRPELELAMVKPDIRPEDRPILAGMLATYPSAAGFVRRRSAARVGRLLRNRRHEAHRGARASRRRIRGRLEPSLVRYTQWAT